MTQKLTVHRIWRGQPVACCGAKLASPALQLTRESHPITCRDPLCAREWDQSDPPEWVYGPRDSFSDERDHYHDPR